MTTRSELFTNNMLLAVDLELVVLFALFICFKIRRRAWRDTSSDAAIALLLVYLGRALDRAVFFIDARGLIGITNRQAIHFAVLVLGLFGANCLLRVFAGVAWGRWAWIWCGGVALIVALVLGI